MPACSIQSSCIRKSPVSLEMLTRRDWVKRFALGTAVALGADGWKGTLLADISPAANPANILTFKTSDYATLQSDYGSMRFSLFGTSIPNGVITITRGPGNVFYATSAYCTHSGCIVDPYDNSPGTEAMICYCHGSVYSISGQVISGVESGQANLPAYNTSFADGVVRVEIPNLNFKVNSTTLFSVNGATKRFQISFPAKSGAKYRILRSSDLVTAPAPISFATSAGGAATTTILSQGSNATRNVWVDSTASSGFYFVDMVINEYIP